MIRSQADQIYRNLKNQISKHQQTSFNKSTSHNRDGCKHLSISASANFPSSQCQVKGNIVEDSMTNLPQPRADPPSGESITNKQSNNAGGAGQKVAR